MKLKIKYFKGAVKLPNISKGSLIDVYASEDIFIKEGTKSMIPLGFSLELPDGWVGNLIPIDSIFKSSGLIEVQGTNIVAENGQWCLPVCCFTYRSFNTLNMCYGTWIHKGDKVAQLKIQDADPDIEFDEIDNKVCLEFDGVNLNLETGFYTGTLSNYVSECLTKPKLFSDEMTYEKASHLTAKALGVKIYRIDLSKQVVSIDQMLLVLELLSSKSDILIHEDTEYYHKLKEVLVEV